MKQCCLIRKNKMIQLIVVNFNFIIIVMNDIISTSDINELYMFQETLGEGAYAQVKKALYLADNSPFAIKIIDKYTQDDLQKKDKCSVIKSFQELMRNPSLSIEFIMQLQHPNIIEIYEVYDNVGYFYIVMEFCQGGELYAPDNLHRCSNQKQIAQIVSTITDALDYCHSNNIVHRDIKPENILWTTKDEEAVLKIADFGVAKLSSQQIMMTACGTPMYFSPEILEGKPYDFAVDYWSLGVISYILLSGRSPFESQNQMQLFEKIKMAKIDFPDRQWRYVSCSAKDFVLRLLDKNPKKRYRAQKIRTHPWIISDHSSQLLFQARQKNLRRFEVGQKVQKIQNLIQKTISQLNQMQQNGSIIDTSMIDEMDEL